MSRSASDTESTSSRLNEVRSETGKKTTFAISVKKTTLFSVLTGKTGFQFDDISASLEISSRSWKEMFYLTMHSTHFIYGYMEREREKCFI